jgi:hypothetical protein
MPKIQRKPRIYARRYKDLFLHARYIPYLRARAQCNFRGEEFELTFEDWCAFWSTPELWARRGRDSDSLSLMRVDTELPWSRDNCCLMDRRTQITISNKRHNGFDWEHLLKDAIYV